MIEVNKDNFEAEVLQASGPVLVDFWSEKCEPCMALLPEMEALEDKLGTGSSSVSSTCSRTGG